MGASNRLKYFETLFPTMRKLKPSNHYLRNQTWKNLAGTALCILVFSALVLFSAWRVMTRLHVDIFEVAVLLCSLVPLGVAFFFWGKYHIYKGGLDGEKRVVKALSSALNNEFYLLSGAAFQRGSDVDQIVIGPNGVFVVETKNWSGKIGCYGDDWQRDRKGKFNSPSRQLKRNVSQVKTIIDQSAFSTLHIPVEGILVFVNKHADLHLNRPTVAVLRLGELPHYILQCPARKDLSGKLPRMLGQEILKKARRLST
jgi:hypothetical protein